MVGGSDIQPRGDDNGDNNNNDGDICAYRRTGGTGTKGRALCNAYTQNTYERRQKFTNFLCIEFTKWHKFHVRIFVLFIYTPECTRAVCFIATSRTPDTSYETAPYINIVLFKCCKHNTHIDIGNNLLKYICVTK